MVSLPDNRFSKEYRIVSSKHYQAIFSQGDKKHFDFFLFFYVLNNQSNARLGISVGKNIFKLAVKRNYVKRVIREQFRQHKIKQYGIDIIVIAKRKMIDISNDQLALSLQQYFDKMLGIVKYSLQNKKQ